MRQARHAPRRLVLAGVLAAVVAFAAGPHVNAVRAVVDRQSRTFTLTDGQSWSVTAAVATVRVVGDPARRDVRVDVVRRARTAGDLLRLPFEARESTEGAQVWLLQAEGALDPALRAEVTVTAPATGSHGRMSVVEGGLEVRGYHGRLDAVVRRGPITAADVSGTLRLETTIGSLEVSGARLTPGGLLRLRAFNGDVRLAFAERPRDARVMALALNGVIRSAIPLTMKDGWGPRWGEATLGSGEWVVSLDVVTGQIQIDAPAAR